MNFGVPSKKNRKEEKYPLIPVMTVGIDGGKGTSRTITFNAKAVEILELDEKKATVAFSFDDGILVMNGEQPQIPNDYKILVTKVLPRRISHKKTYSFISKSLNLDNTIENEFKIERVEKVDGEPTVFKAILDAVTTVSEDLNLEKNDTEDVDFNLDNEIQNQNPVAQSFSGTIA